MSLGLVDDIAFQEELARLSGAKKPDIIVKEREVRGKEIPLEIKKLAAEDALNGGNQHEIAKSYGITQPTVSAAENGMNATNTDVRKPNVDLLPFINTVKTKIVKRASSKVLKALDAITEEKIEGLSANKAAQLARDCTAIMKDMSVQESNNNQDNRVQIVIHAPRERSIDEFEVVKAINE